MADRLPNERKGTDRVSLSPGEAPSKRHWDQDTPQEPNRKKTDTSPNVQPSLPKQSPLQSKIKFGFSGGIKGSENKDMKGTTSDKQDTGFVIKSGSLKPAPIKMSLGAQKPKESSNIPKTKVNAKVASVFNADESDDEEEMPPEAKMRMKNVGRETPTAAGPNSFGKGRLGFCDRQRMIEKEVEQYMANADRAESADRLQT